MLEVSLLFYGASIVLICCRSFAKKRDHGIDDPDNPSIMTWLTHRDAFTVACIDMSESDDILPASFDPPELNAMVALYHDLTSLKWIKEWSTLVSECCMIQT